MKPKERRRKIDLLQPPSSSGTLEAKTTQLQTSNGKKIKPEMPTGNRRKINKPWSDEQKARERNL